MKYKIIQGDCLEQLKRLPDNSIDSLVTDPPAGISFMGKEWDDNKGNRDNWIDWLEEIMIEVKRVLKPGGHGLVWSLPRTSHWTATALEDAGFEVRDCIQHLFGSGFPKSHNIGKAYDKKMGNEREDLGNNPNCREKADETIYEFGLMGKNKQLTKGKSQWEGWGTGLKPSSEFWWLIRKPLSEKSIVDNVIKWGVGGINIDKSRIPTGEVDDIGRFPAHTIHDGSEEVMKEFEKAGKSKSSSKEKKKTKTSGKTNWFRDNKEEEYRYGFGDEGSVARFFYCSKPSPAEKHMGLEEIESKEVNNTENKGRTYNDRCKNCGKKFIGPKDKICSCDNPETDKSVFKLKNSHPTVKSVKLMSYLINMITPKGGIVIDPFMGSGTTGIASLLNEYRFIGIEKEEEYIKIAEERIKNYEKYRKFL